MKKSSKLVILTMSMVMVFSMISTFSSYNMVKAVNSDSTEKEGPEQNQYYTIIDEDGNVITKEYEDDVVPNTLKSNDYKVVKKIGDKTTIVDNFDTYEEAKKEVSQLKKGRAVGVYDIQAFANTTGINNGVARLIGYTSYTEVDNGKSGRAGYTHGTSANDAAFISTSADGSTVRVKQAGVIMDIPAGNVEVTEYNANSNVSYYMSKSGKLYHYYYSGAYGVETNLSSTQVGYTPSGLSDDVKYYSYDGHYFYTDYTTMISDYRSGLDYYGKSVNAYSPFYNYYQYLSLRSTTQFAAADMNKIITDTKGADTASKLKDQGQALLNVQAKYGINSSLMFGVGINESGWGLSKYSQDRNNLFGIGAVDSNPDAALSFSSVEACFDYFAYKLISCGYLDGMSWKYRGPHLGDKRSGINVKYASDPYWGEKAASFSYRMNSNTGDKDYQKYQLAIAKEAKLNFYQNASTSKVVYNSTVDDKNENLYNYPVTILSTSGGFYKILSDTVLNDARTGQNPTNTFNINRDYVFVSTSDVDLNGTTSSSYIRGDVSGNKLVEADDYMMIKLHVLKRKILTGSQLIRADINGDGVIDASDYMLVKLHVLGRQLLS
ncbi:MAG: glucosaminidase domain-containing protein [Coprobacillus sp.]